MGHAPTFRLLTGRRHFVLGETASPSAGMSSFSGADHGRMVMRLLSRRVGTNRDFGETLLRSLRVLARCVLTDGHENRRRQRNRFVERSGARGLRVTITSPLAALQLCFFRCSWEPLARPDESPLNGSMQARF